VVDKEAMGQVFPLSTWIIPCQFSFRQCSIFFHLSPRRGTIRPSAEAELSLVSPNNKKSFNIMAKRRVVLKEHAACDLFFET
jgi:hypothetical protein